ncbi:hypothetical protein EXIGLDRAFT_255658 [Exidia glandulosa HHB12029]|uniref:DNA mismatch repair proteins mutS family domain-containing protein n=1 Tax=Exidia glandulosa HHB12029 TaxID=1314781 RepID=A0A165DW93_EXIGL|nr:hypothetical protein EXIGLDRAFT_255658 [Exidia glandulosa HHB12029]
MEEKQGNCQVRPHREFVASKGKDKLYSLPLFTDQAQPHDSSTMASSDSGPTRSREAYNFLRGRDRQQMADADAVRWQASIRIANFVEAERSPLCMACVNALLEQIHRTRAFGELDTDTHRIVNNIESLRLDQYMQINMDALLSLQIFEEQHHASMHSDKTKEGLSLFGTLNYTKTRAGYDLLRQWFLRPSLSLETINERHTAVECFLRADNLSVCGALRTHLKGVRNVPHMLTAMQRGRAEARDWETLCKFAFHAAMLADSLEELAHGDDVAIVQKLKECLDTADFKVMGEEVNSTIDWEASALNQRVCVRPLIDPELDQYKELYDGLDSFMNHVSAQVAMEVSADVVPALNVVYFPQIGFLICVPKPEGWRREEPELGPSDWTYSFHTEESVYLKSDKMHDVDHHIGDIQTMIAERELEIVHALYERIVPYAPAVGAACGVMAELDCLLSFAQASLIHGYIKPMMTNENVLAVRGGRHPLHEQVVDTFIPNDSFLVGGIGIGVADGDEEEADNADDGGDDGILQQTERSVMVITGANACGKSVYLKQVALLQFMAQIGCFVPVESATIGLVDKIFTRVQARESISKIQSSFMLDLNQVSLALRNSTARSLILLDEFGKGTLDTDGAGLLVGVLRHLLGRGADCPRVLATTHFRDVFRADIVPPSLPLLLAHMRVMLVREEGADGIVYLYKVAPGLSLESHAAKCAAVCGLPKPVVDRAQYVTCVVALSLFPPRRSHIVTEFATDDHSSHVVN